jgi:hypothetical protein
MVGFRCPGQDTRNWNPVKDVYDVNCPNCGRKIEFFKDDPHRKCFSCGLRIGNPRIDQGCAKWCEYAEQCVGPPNIGDDTNTGGQAAAEEGEE